MARTGGEKTKQRILDTAEQLFAERGFDATSVDRIAQRASVNKALIYYYFKDKNDLIVSLYAKVIRELEERLEDAIGPRAEPPSAEHIRDKIREEIRSLTSKKPIISLMVMEALKSGDSNPILFTAAKLVIEQERKQSSGSDELTAAQRHWSDVHEFFTGFLPLIMFVVLEEKWVAQFGGDRDTALDHFVDVFARSHLASHDPPDLDD